MNWRVLVVIGILMALPGFVAAEVEFVIGPYDYTNPTDRKHLAIVEQYHFREAEKVLKQGDETIWKDLDYTLRVFPNHHLALVSMGRLLRMKNPGVMAYGRPINKTVEYYFQRAKEFAPQDGVVRLLNGMHFHKIGKLQLALEEYQVAIQLIPDSADLHYNMGLLYTELRQYDEAIKHAKHAYELGHPLPGLRNKLRRVGKWQE